MINLPMPKNSDVFRKDVEEHSVINYPMFIIDAEEFMAKYWAVEDCETFFEKVFGVYQSRYVLRITFDFRVIVDLLRGKKYKLTIDGEYFRVREFYEENEYKLYKRKKVIKKVLGEQD